jgi:peroxiredoxin
MKGYQAGIQKFEGMETQVFGISTDNVPSLKRFAEDTGASFPLLSDFAKRETAKKYGVLMEGPGIANRATFVVDADGKIAYIQEGKEAVDPLGAETACSRLKKKS